MNGQPTIWGSIVIGIFLSAGIFGFAIWPYTMFLMFKAQKSEPHKQKFEKWMRFYLRIFLSAFGIFLISLILDKLGALKILV